MPGINALSPAELAIKADTEAQLAAGGDPFGDDEPIIAETVESQAAAAAAEQAAANALDGVDEPDDADPPVAAAGEPPPAAIVEEPAAAVAQAVEPAEPPRAPQFRTENLVDIDAKTQTLIATKAAAFKKVMDGEMEPAEYATLDANTTQQLNQMLVQRTLIEANAQNAANTEREALLAIIEQSNAAGQVNYRTDVKASKRFDMEMQLLASDPDNAGRPYKALAREAHASVLAVLGIAKAAGPAAAPTVPTGKPPAREAPVPPLSLRGLPNASTANSGGGAEEALGRLKGTAFQDAYSKLTAAQKAALVDD